MELSVITTEPRNLIVNYFTEIQRRWDSDNVVSWHYLNKKPMIEIILFYLNKEISN